MAHNDLHIWIKYLSETNLSLRPHNRNLNPSLALILIKISRPIILLPIPNIKTKNLNAQHLNQRAQSMTQRVQNVDPNQSMLASLRQLMMPKIASKSHNPHVLQTILAKQKKRRPCREYQCGTGQIPSEGQVRELSQLQSVRVEVNYVYLDL